SSRRRHTRFSRDWSSDVCSSDLGYGLVQWTPFNKYTIWARDNDLDYSHIDSQLMRIEYELQNGIQWISTSDYPLSFQDFKISTRSEERRVGKERRYRRLPSDYKI